MRDDDVDAPAATDIQRAACASMGTKQCAAICLSHLPSYAAGECPEAAHVWTVKAIEKELQRRPVGPLFSCVARSIDGLLAGKQ